MSLVSWDFGQRASVTVDQNDGRVRGDQQVVADRQVVEELERLERADEPGAGPLVRGGAGDVSAVEADAARCGAVKPVSVSMKVVLPAPFGPIRPTI